MTTRRTFLRVAGAVGAALGIVQYTEPLQFVPDRLFGLHDWIEDRGDFYIVRVPDFKSFAHEHLRKPTRRAARMGRMVLPQRPGEYKKNWLLAWK